MCRICRKVFEKYSFLKIFVLKERKPDKYVFQVLHQGLQACQSNVKNILHSLELREAFKKKNRFFLGKSPKLWVGGGQES